MEGQGAIRRRFCHGTNRFWRHRPGAQERHARKCRPFSRLAAGGQNRDAGSPLATSTGMVYVMIFFIGLGGLVYVRRRRRRMTRQRSVGQLAS